jgi:hypothetical protein
MNCVYVGGPRDAERTSIPDERAVARHEHIVEEFKPPYFHGVKHHYVYEYTEDGGRLVWMGKEAT